MNTKIILRLPKLILLASLSPVGLSACQLREVVLKNGKAIATPIVVSQEENKIFLACLLTCGQSCSHTDNC